MIIFPTGTAPPLHPNQLNHMMMKQTMYSLIFTVVAVLISLGAQGQDRGISYQAVARDANDALLTNQNLIVRFTLIQGGSTAYQEVQTVTTNDYGLFTAVIGSDDFTSFNAIDWSPSTDLQVEIDPGTGYVDMGTTTLESVPYAKTAIKVTDVKIGELTDVSDAAPSTGQVLEWDGSEWAPATPSTGIEPIAFAYISSNGTVNSGSGNVSVSYDNGIGRYIITITGESYFFSNYVTVVTPSGGFSGNVSEINTSSSGGNLLVYLRDDAGNAIQENFQFVTFKP